MRTSLSVKFTGLLLAIACSIANAPASLAGECTLPPDKYPDIVSPELAAKYKYTEDGEYTTKLGVPTYEWMPVGPEAANPKAIVIGVHGLTLHGRRYRVLARALAINGVGFVSWDMPGFGRCATEPRWSTPKDDKTQVHLEKAYQELVELTKLVKEKYPESKIVILGESLGCTFCVRVAGEHKELIYGIVLSAPAVKVNPDMIVGGGNIVRGMEAIVKPHHYVDLHSFIKNLVSNRKQVVDEMLDDPLIAKKLKLGALLSTDLFVDKTSKWGKETSETLPILILQGSHDNCVSPKHVTDLMNNMPSNDQTLAWRGQYGHLQLETQFMRAQIVDALVDWMYNHGAENKVNLETFEKNISDLGGVIVK